MNITLARHTISMLSRLGVREYCVCPGGRSAPLVQVLAFSEQLTKYFFFDERAAAFFALGRIRNTERPVAVVTTSGTAVGELLPAAMEAHYSGLPLVLLTADRPRSYRGTGAPQAAEQAGIFSVYAATIDVADTAALELPRYDRTRPLHINVCFDEPLLDEVDAPFATPPQAEAVDRKESSEFAAEQEQLSRFLAASRFPLVLVGGLASRESVAVKSFLSQLQAPFYAEAQSGLREDDELSPWRLQFGDRLLDSCRRSGWLVDGVLRIGSVPTHRIWRDLEVKERNIPVCSLSALPFSGMTRSMLICAPLCALLTTYVPEATAEATLIRTIVARDATLTQSLDALLEDEPRCEPALVRQLSMSIPRRSRVFLGNSLPIRHWDFAATYSDRALAAFATRGLNGIDGQIATFLGLCRPQSSNWGIFGDLTTLYDATAPWILRQLSDVQAQIVVINNGGGRIFERIFPGRPEYLTEHDLSFGPIADLWRLKYEQWDAIPISLDSTESRIIELVPDASATRRFWHRYEQLT